VLFVNGFVVMIMAEQPVVVFCSFLDRKLDAIRAAGEGGTVAHVLPEDELPMNATGLETLDNIWGLFETSLRMDSMQARTKMFEMAKWLEESQNLLDWIVQAPKEKQAWMGLTN